METKNLRNFLKRHGRMDLFHDLFTNAVVLGLSAQSMKDHYEAEYTDHLPLSFFDGVFAAAKKDCKACDSGHAEPQNNPRDVW
jgi:hypothetical protein